MLPVVYLKLAVVQAHICMLSSGTRFSLFTTHTYKTSVLQKTHWFIINCNSSGRAMAQAVSCRPLTVQARVRSQANPCEICDGQSGIVGQVSLRVLFSLRFIVTIITPVLHSHLFIPHKRYIILAIDRILK
jgi:hypothetical protein